MAELLSVHDPRGYPPKVTGKRLAPRPAGLDGKIVYLVDCLFDNSAAFMEQLRQWFAEHLPAVNTKIVTPRDDFSVVYQLRPEGERWQVIRITVEDVSLTANLGSQLDHLLSRDSVEDVLNLMERKYGSNGGGA